MTSRSSALESPLAAELNAHVDRAASPAAPYPELVSSPSGVRLDKRYVESLIAREYAGLRSLIFRRVGDVQTASDLLNEAACVTWEKWQAGKIERPEQIAGYIFQVAMNLLRNRRRCIAERPEKRAAARDLDALALDDPQEREGIEASIAGQVKCLLLSMASQRDRTLLVRFYLNEDDKASICRDLQLTPTQFARVLHRAHGRLRQLLESRGLKGSDLYSLLLVM